MNENHICVPAVFTGSMMGCCNLLFSRGALSASSRGGRWWCRSWTWLLQQTCQSHLIGEPVASTSFSLSVCSCLPQCQCLEQRSPSLLQDQNTACTPSQHCHPTRAPSAQSFCAPAQPRYVEERILAKLTSPDNLLKSNCLASFDALGVLILSIHLYSGSSETTSSSTKPGRNCAR